MPMPKNSFDLKPLTKQLQTRKLSFCPKIEQTPQTHNYCYDLSALVGSGLKSSFFAPYSCFTRGSYFAHLG